VVVPHPSMEEKGMTTMRLQRLHLSSNPCPRTLAISCPHSQRVSPQSGECLLGDAALTIAEVSRLNEIENDY
jgi:hypothetical protein